MRASELINLINQLVNVVGDVDIKVIDSDRGALHVVHVGLYHGDGEERPTTIDIYSDESYDIYVK